MNEPKSTLAGTACSDIREQKYLKLIYAADEVRNLLHRLENFMNEIGLPSEVRKNTETPEVQMEGSLVTALVTVPQEIHSSCTEAHDILNRISDALN
jgi:hypothetical protein